MCSDDMPHTDLVPSQRGTDRLHARGLVLKLVAEPARRFHIVVVRCPILIWHTAPRDRRLCSSSSPRARSRCSTSSARRAARTTASTLRSSRSGGCVRSSGSPPPFTSTDEPSRRPVSLTEIATTARRARRDRRRSTSTDEPPSRLAGGLGRSRRVTRRVRTARASCVACEY